MSKHRSEQRRLGFDHPRVSNTGTEKAFDTTRTGLVSLVENSALLCSRVLLAKRGARAICSALNWMTIPHAAGGRVRQLRRSSLGRRFRLTTLSDDVPRSCFLIVSRLPRFLQRKQADAAVRFHARFAPQGCRKTTQNRPLTSAFPVTGTVTHCSAPKVVADHLLYFDARCTVKLKRARRWWGMSPVSVLSSAEISPSYACSVHRAARQSELSTEGESDTHTHRWGAEGSEAEASTLVSIGLKSTLRTRP